MQSESLSNLQTNPHFAPESESAHVLQKFADFLAQFCKTFCRTRPLFPVTALRQAPPVA
ncbi:hypothetical protein [Tabrizicola sp. M-4]|uniref:hypothetical protein n=1 Tax=Tabrizicola sp. M-4 TaxID=3055847 RepID=UPI003DA918C7